MIVVSAEDGRAARDAEGSGGADRHAHGDGRRAQRPCDRPAGVETCWASSGTGIQAKMQGEMIARLLGLGEILVYGRNAWTRRSRIGRRTGRRGGRPGRTVRARGPDRHHDAVDFAPVLTADLVRPGTRIVAVGADTPGKQELETALTAKARLIVDSAVQCAHHGEAGWPIRAGLIDPEYARSNWARCSRRRSICRRRYRGRRPDRAWRSRISRLPRLCGNDSRTEASEQKGRSIPSPDRPPLFCARRFVSRAVPPRSRRGPLPFPRRVGQP
jgi:hypothetical protein